MNQITEAAIHSRNIPRFTFIPSVKPSLRNRAQGKLARSRLPDGDQRFAAGAGSEPVYGNVFPNLHRLTLIFQKSTVSDLGSG